MDFSKKRLDVILGAPDRWTYGLVRGIEYEKHFLKQQRRLRFYDKNVYILNHVSFPSLNV
jgi:hypothetical protein